MLIRRERAADQDEVHRLVTAAFTSPEQTQAGLSEPIEARLLDWLRADNGWLPKLSLVAVEQEVVVGHVLCTRGRVGDHPALGLAPLSVLPTNQGKGLGSALMHAILAAAEALNEAWGDHFQVRALTGYAGQVDRFEYAEPFGRL